LAGAVRGDALSIAVFSVKVVLKKTSKLFVGVTSVLNKSGSAHENPLLYDQTVDTVADGSASKLTG
jgi:hypothetical protein